MDHTLLQRYHLTDKRTVVSAIVILTFAIALLSTDSSSRAVAIGVGVTGVAAASLLLISFRQNDPKFLWFALDLAALISGLIAIFIGFAKYQESERATELKLLKAQVVERHVSLLQSAKISYFECSGQVAAPLVEPKDNCTRLGHFTNQMEEELQRPSLIEMGRSNRWDLNLCPEDVRAASKSWDLLCESAKSLANAQSELQKQLQSAPESIFVSLLSGKSLFFWLVLTGILYGGKVAKFVFDAFKPKESTPSKNA
jgi:hypothetical protein